MLRMNVLKKACRFVVDQFDMFWSWAVLGLKNILMLFAIVLVWIISGICAIALASFVIKPVTQSDGWLQLTIGAIILAVFAVLSFFVVKKLVELSNVWALNALDAAFQQPWRMFDTKVVNFKVPLLLFAQGCIIAIGFVLLVIPGIIFAVRFSLARYVMLDQVCGVRQALRTSWNMTKGEEWHLLLLLFMMFVYRIIPFIAFFECFFSVSNLMYASIYVQIKQQRLLQ